MTSRAVEADGRLDIGDRELLLLSPPVYDAPGTAAVLDGRTGTLWAADAFGIPVADHAEDARDLPRRDFEDGFAAYHRVLAPWLALPDATRWDATVSALAALTPLAVVSAHGPALTGARLEAAFDLLRRLPDLARARAPTWTASSTRCWPRSRRNHTPRHRFTKGSSPCKSQSRRSASFAAATSTRW